ncbi:acyloxyacyl hydrolase [uncultured Tenacibaculum sp.]|uniref:acyloxyacyl hydrolase n=1 Tax=uncultured Tenacibaculum sp. TaxID=174713 RepID=UPI0026302534|nr:acyloxyacyl hydrolase [uncultured Tenacibaculum sp.]
MKLYFFFFFSFFLIFKVKSQEEQKKNATILIGLNYGKSFQDIFPFNDPDYLYKNQFLKIQINYLLKQNRNFSYELLVEPSLYFSEHQLLNKYFVTPGPNYIEKRERFTKRKLFKEYAINVGIVVRYRLLNNFSTYFLGSIGPMISAVDTERLKKGFAFSDVLGVGFSYKQKELLFDFRLTLRHNSNANLYFPNKGHNSIGFESGVSFEIK